MNTLTSAVILYVFKFFSFFILHMSRDYPLDLRGKEIEIVVCGYFSVFGRGKSLMLLASSVNSSSVLREFCFIKKKYVLHIFSARY